MKFLKRMKSSKKVVEPEPEVRAPRRPSNAMESFMQNLQQESSKSNISIVIDNAPMLPASFAQSVSYDPEISCDYDAMFAEARWDCYFRKRSAEKARRQNSHHDELEDDSSKTNQNCVPPRRSMDFDACSVEC